MRNVLRNLAGLALGLLVGTATVEAAKQVASFPLGQAIECAFNQPAPSLAEANSMRAGTIYDQGPEVIVPIVCQGSASPFACSFPVPAANRTVGSHSLTYRIGNVEFDGSISWDPVSETRPYTITPALKGAPGHNTGGVIRKIGGGIGQMVKQMLGMGDKADKPAKPPKSDR